MGLLARLFRDPPRSRGPVPDLAVDLADLAVCGFGRGASLDDLERRLGVSERRGGKRGGVLAYPELGLQVAGDSSGSLAGFTVILHPDLWAGLAFRGFEGVWLPWGSKSPPTEASLIRVLGRPALRDCQNEEICVEWDGAQALVAADYALDASLLALYVDFDR